MWIITLKIHYFYKKFEVFSIVFYGVFNNCKDEKYFIKGYIVLYVSGQ